MATVTADFIESLFGFCESGWISTFTLPARQTRFTPINLNLEFADKIATQAERSHDQNVYFGVGVLGEKPTQGRGSEGDVTAIPGVWVDIDVQGHGHESDNLPPTFESAMDLIFQVPFTPTWIIYTGGGLHAYWCFNEPWGFGGEGDRQDALKLSEDFQRHIAAIADFQGGWHVDPTYDLARIMRLPGTTNQKYGKAVEVVEHHERSRVSPMELQDWIDDFGIDSPVFEGGGEVWEGDGSSEGEGTTLEDAGGRNNRMKAIVSSRLERGETLESTVFEALQYDAQNHNPPLFSDPTEFRSSDAYTNALKFVGNIVESINRRRERQGQDTERFQFGGGLEHNPAVVEDESSDGVDIYSFGDIYNDDSPLPSDIVDGGLVAPGGFTLIAGPPKSQKSLLCQDLGIHVALGEPFMGHNVEQGNVAFVNVEMSYRVIRKRFQLLDFDPHQVSILDRNFRVTDRFHNTLDDAGAADMVDVLDRTFEGDETPDLIMIDPMVNIFPGESENENQTMMNFLERLESVRDAVNPDAGLILVHHCRKVTRDELREDPFTMIRGAGALRGHYSSGIAIMKESEEATERRLFFDIRIDEAPSPKSVEFRDGHFEEVAGGSRVAGKSQGSKYDAEARRKGQVICQEIARLAEEESRLITASQFAEGYANQKGLGSDRSIKRKISELATKGYIAYCDARDLNHDLPHPNSRGFLAVEGMEYLDPDTMEFEPVTPQKKKHPDTGAVVEWDGWIYQDDGDPLWDEDTKIYRINSG